MATYTELVNKINSWANRETIVLPPEVIKDCINYATDNAYRSLRIAPLERTRTYSVPTSMSGENMLNIPQDTIAFIELNRVDTNGDYIPYSSKLDIRSFREVLETLSLTGDNTNQRQDGPKFWTRDKGSLVLYPKFQGGETFEVHYYRRLPEANARYAAVAMNTNANTVAFDSANATGQTGENLYYHPTSASELKSYVENQAAEKTAVAIAVHNLTVFDADLTLESSIKFITPEEATVAFPTGYYLGKLQDHWLRDENEKVMLFGALSQVFDYLDELEQSAKYMEKFMMEIEKLNLEEKERIPSGGSAVTYFGSPLL